MFDKLVFCVQAEDGIRDFGMGVEFRRVLFRYKVISLMEEKYNRTQWGLINSITEVAQDFTLERRVELEKIAGRMLHKVA